MTSGDILKIAHFIGLHDAEMGCRYVDGERVIYTTYYKGLPNVNEFDPVHDPADTCRVLEHIAKYYGRVEICEGGTLVCIGAQAMAGGGDFAEALCAAVLEILGK